MLRFLKKNLYPILILGIVALISLLAYKPGTFLTGWDTLHPEFDFGLNFERMFNGVWREEQGLGALAGHTHMADLPRVGFLWVLHFVLPLNALRYLYVFLCLLMGPLGTFYLLKHIFGEGYRSQVTGYGLVAFLGSLFYLLNLGTLQQFYAPFEMFTMQYALLPWTILFSLKYLNDDATKKKWSLLLFSLFTLLATPQAYAAHLWYPFFGIFSLFLLLQKSFKKSVILILLTLAINSFWLLPNLYYIFTSSNVPKESKQNRIFSQEYRLRNQENGYIQDVAIAKGFYFQWSAYNSEKNKFEYLMPEWRRHLSNPAVQTIGYVFFGFSLGGLFLAFKRRQKTLLSFAPFVIVPFIFLMNHTPPFSWLYNYLLNFSLFEEAVRFIFTKLSILLVFGYAIYLSYFLVWVFDKLNSKSRLYILFSIFYILALLAFCFPLLRGHLISDKFKIKVPDQYFQLWKYMKTQPNETVLTLPLHTFSGWQYNKWGYQGSGFIWFGMKQPVLDRDSDRWSISNEQAFRELQYTLYSQRVEQFDKTLKKFGVGYIVWDTSIITPSEKNRNQILYQRETEAVLAKLVNAGLLRKVETFGAISVYKIQRSSPLTQETLQIESQISPPYRWSFSDQGYMDQGNYITFQKPTKLRTFTYPFRDFLVVTDRFKDEASASISELKHPIKYSASRLIAKQQVDNVVALDKDGNDEIIRFKTKNSSQGISLQNDSFPHNLGYVVGFTSKNVQGLPLRFCLKNLYSNICDIYDELTRSDGFVSDYFVVPPFDKGQGYGLSIDNISYGDYESINELKEVVTYPLYYDYLAAQNDQSGGNDKLNVLTNNQAFHPGWIAIKVTHSTSSGQADYRLQVLGDHVLVNNWANGWLILEDDGLRASRYTIIFWPQYLQYFGFALLLATGLYLWKKQA